MSKRKFTIVPATAGKKVFGASGVESTLEPRRSKRPNAQFIGTNRDASWEYFVRPLVGTCMGWRNGR